MAVTTFGGRLIDGVFFPGPITGLMLPDTYVVPGVVNRSWEIY